MEYKSNEIKTTNSKGLIIFVSIVLALSIGGIVAFIFLDENPILKGFFIIIFAVFAVLAFIVLYDQLFDYVLIKDDYIVSKILLKKKKTKIKNVTKIILSKGSYDIYVKEEKFCTLSRYDKSTPMMINQFEKHGFDLTKIIKEVDAE